MKKTIRLIAVVLILVTVGSLCACKQEEKKDNTLRVGFAKANINPDYSTGMSGYGDIARRKSTGVAEDIYATCIAVTEGENTVLMYTIDSISATNYRAEEFRVTVSHATGVPKENIFFGATHSHSCPEPNNTYNNFSRPTITQLAVDAMADREEATLSANHRLCSFSIRMAQLQSAIQEQKI